MAVLISLHILSVVIWVGGMFFAYLILRPTAADLMEGPERLALWRGVFQRFFPWVKIAIALILITGYGMIFGVLGGMKQVGLHIHIMQGLGIVMMLLFGHVYFAGFKRLKMALDARDLPDAAKRLDQIRKLIGINLWLGIATIVIASGGRYLIH